MWGHTGVWVHGSPCGGSLVWSSRAGKEGKVLEYPEHSSFLPSCPLPWLSPSAFPAWPLGSVLQPAPAPGGCHSNPLPAGVPSARRCPDGGRAHPAPPSLRSQLLVSPDLARSVPGCGWRWGHHTGRGVPPWGYLHGPFVLGSHHSPSPRRFMRCLADGCWIQHPVPSVLVSPRRNPHLHPKQG